MTTIPVERELHLRVLGMLSSYVTTLAGIDFPDNDEGDYHQRLNETKRAAVNSTIAELRALLAEQPQAGAGHPVVHAAAGCVACEGSPAGDNNPCQVCGGTVPAARHDQGDEVLRDAKRYRWIAENADVDCRGGVPDGDYSSLGERIDAALTHSQQGEEE